MKSYKLLYANGCSFTNHFPLKEQDKWPENLASELSIPEYINHGQGAGSNQGIFKRTAKFLTETQVPSGDILAVIQLTYPFRFEMPTPNHISGWQNYITMGKQTDLISDYLDKSKTNSNYYKARLESFAEHESYEAWEFFMQASAISNLLSKWGVQNYFLNLQAPRPGLHEPVSGNNRGNLTEEIKFDYQFINWMFDTPWESNMNKLVNSIGYKKTEYTISSLDSHFNGNANRALSKLMSTQIKLKE